MKNRSSQDFRKMRFLVAFLCLMPWLMGQSTCQVRSPLAGKKSYGANAQQLYVNGQKLLKGGNYQEARKVFQRIKTKYPFSSFATLADLAIGDAFFKAGKYLRAVDIYKLFAKLHPSHPKAGYASFKVGEAYEKLRPYDWFLVPPSYQKDATHTRQAINAYRSFIRVFPGHKLVPKAKEKVLFSLNLMAKHELSVANFYAKRGKHRAVLWRMEYLIKKYPKVPICAEARYRKAVALSNLKRYKDAQAAFQEVVSQHPKSAFAKQAKGKIGEMKAKAKKKAKPRPRPTPARRPAPRRAEPPARRAPEPRRAAPAPRPEPRRREPPARKAPARRPAPEPRRRAPEPRRDAPVARRAEPPARRAPEPRRDAPAARRPTPEPRRAAPAARRAPEPRKEVPARRAPAKRSPAKRAPAKRAPAKADVSTTKSADRPAPKDR